MDLFDLNMVSVENLSQDLIPQAADLAADAFANSPLYNYIYLDCTPAQRRSELKWLFERNIELIHSKSPEVCFCGFDRSPGILSEFPHGRLCCFFMLADDAASSISLCAKLSAGLLWLPLRIGFASMGRLLAVSDYAEAVEEEIALDSATKSSIMANDASTTIPFTVTTTASSSLTSNPTDAGRFLRLARMVVAPVYQGRGVGSKCLEFALSKADLENRVVVLGTQEERNVEFYSRLGFVAVREVMYPLDGEPGLQFHWWFMKRLPSTKSVK